MHTVANASLDGSKQKDERISLEVLAKLTGFPVETIKDELFNKDLSEDKDISLEELREIMLKYIDSTLIKE